MAEQWHGRAMAWQSNVNESKVRASTVETQLKDTVSVQDQTIFLTTQATIWRIVSKHSDTICVRDAE